MKSLLEKLECKLAYPILFLIGAPCVGKTTIGQALSNEWQCSFLDTDDWIEQSLSLTISEIFAQLDEAVFRRCEFDLIKSLFESWLVRGNQPWLDNQAGMVIACGGGLPVNPINFERLKLMGKVVYLTHPASSLAQRILYDRQQGKDRPLIQPTNDLQEIKLQVNKLLQARGEIYEKADLTIDTESLTIAQVTSLVKAAVRLIT